MNLGYVPIDVYEDGRPSNQPGLAPTGYWVPACTLATILECYQNAFQHYRSQQQITGVRFMMGLRGAGHSTPLKWNGVQWYVDPVWRTNLGRLLDDLKNKNITKLAPTFQLAGQQGDVTVVKAIPNTCKTPPQSELFLFYQTAPYAHRPDGIPHDETGNDAYNCSPIDPNDPQTFVGWPAIFALIDAVLAEVQSRTMNIFQLDLQNEVGLDPFTVYGRLIYDNKRNVNVYQAVRSLMSARGFDPGRAGYSAGELR
jgi:hypothetical protein